MPKTIASGLQPPGLKVEALRLKPEALRAWIDPASLPRSSREWTGPQKGVIGQERALRALQFGLAIREEGFHVYVAGPPGVGRMTSVRLVLDELSAGQPVPSDWCYVHNFEDPYRPRALRLPAGLGRELRSHMEQLLEHFIDEIPKAFEAEEYGSRRDDILRALQKERGEIFKEIQGKASRMGFTVQPSPVGWLISPASSPAEKEKAAGGATVMSEELQARGQELDRDIKGDIARIRALEGKARQELKELDAKVVQYVCGGLIQEMLERYKGLEDVGRYIRAVGDDVQQNSDALRRLAAEGDGREEGARAAGSIRRAPYFRKYAVNVVVDHSGRKGAPVVEEWNPWLGELLGRIEKEGRFGDIQTDLTLIKAGALHRANGGYLVLPVEELLRSPFSWDALKRTLLTREIRFEDPEEKFGWFAIKSLRPEPIPLDVKVVLVGSPDLYYLLQTYDESFPELFRVKVEFDTRMPRDEKGTRAILAFLDSLSRKEKLLPVDPQGAARLIEHAMRLAEDQGHLSAHFGALAEVVREANHWAKKESADRIGASHVRRALEEKVYRSGLAESHLRDLIREGTILIDLAGSAVGQVNGLSVIQMGDYAFGRPSRITASVGPGREGLVDIEREVELSGPIHSKGILILNGYLVHRYAQNRPLTLTARLVFEQSYAGVEGDSASSAELYALLSVLSGLPVRQGVAVTGSVNQHGEVQAIGGVNEKVEGFFDVCRMKGLTGEQGVIIPESNRKSLMLREDVIEAVRAGRFHLWAVRDVDEGIALLTGVEAGSPALDGSFPAGTVNRLVDDKLREFAETLRAEAVRAPSPDGSKPRRR